MKIKKLLLVPILGLALLVACVVPAWVSTAESIAKVAVPIAGTLVSIIVPVAGPAAAVVQTGFNALIKAFDTYKASQTDTNLQAISAILNAVNQHITDLEVAAHIKDPNTDATVKALVQLISEAFAKIVALTPGANKTVMLPAHRAMGAAKDLKASDFKDAFNAIVASDPRLAGREIK